MNKYKKTILNVVYGFMSYAFPSIVLQFVIQPIIADKIGGENNGLYLTLMSFNFFFISITATVLNTVRLLRQEEYNKASVVGDFNIIYVIYIMFAVIVMPIAFILYSDEFDLKSMVLYVIITLLYLYHDYIGVEYRLKLQYNKILVNNLCMVVGYGIGTIVFLRTGTWQYVYIIAYIIGNVYDYFNTGLIKEPLKKTVLFKSTANKLLLLTGGATLSSMITYSDKLLLYPLLGGTQVSIYNSAAVIGKMLSLLAAPINSILLSYLVNIDENRIKIKKKYIVVVIMLLFVMYLFFLVVGKPITFFLYPEWAEKSVKYIPITVLSGVLLFCENLINTMIIRYRKSSFQICIQGINLIAYLSLSVIGIKIAGLMGFCIGLLVSNAIKLLIGCGVLFSRKSSKEISV